MSQEPRTRRALELVRELSDPEVLPVRPESVLGELGFDSLAFAELALALEEELGVDLGEVEIGGSNTVADVLEGVERAAPTSGEVEMPASVGRLQGVADLLGGWPLGWWLALEVVGAEHVPGLGPAILAMNHESALDIPIAVVACPRRITFMAKGELFKNGIASWGLERLGGFRVDRGRFDLRAVRLALAVIDRGEVLGMYPEGTRSPGELLPFLHGAAWVALATGTPLVPVSLRGTEQAGHAKRPRRVQVRAIFGEPLEVEAVEGPSERRRRAAELTAELRATIEAGLRA